MNNKLFGLICLGLLSMSAPIHSDEPNTIAGLNWWSKRTKNEKQPSPQPLTSTELRAAAFFPLSHKFREIYGNVGVSLQAEATRTFEGLRNLGVWANGEWIFMDGKPRASCGSTDLDIFNISFGVKGIGHFFDDTLFMYAGIGPNLGLIFVENKRRCCKSCGTKKQHRSRAAAGVTVKTGAEFYFTRIFYVSFFADYLYLPIFFDPTIDMGGFKVGGGLGARF